MRFFVRKRRTAPTVIIVALIDVLIVMLIFLMVTTTFKQQPAVKLALPESTQAARAGADENAPLIVTIDPQGTLRVGSEARPVTIERFAEELLARAAQNKDLRVAISADKAAPVGQFIKVLDAAKAAKVKGVSAYTKEPARP